MRCFSKYRREAWILRAFNLAIFTPSVKQNPNDTKYRVLTFYIINMEVMICEMEKRTCREDVSVFRHLVKPLLI